MPSHAAGGASTVGFSMTVVDAVVPQWQELGSIQS